MPKLDDVLGEDVIHAVRSDGSQIIAMKVRFSDTEEPMWEVRKTNKDGQFTQDDKITLDGGKEPAVYRKTLTSDQLKELADTGDYLDWDKGFTSTPKQGEQKKRRTSRQKQEETAREDAFAQWHDILDQVAIESPSDIQKIVIDQMKIGTRYYEEAVAQSKMSFDLARTTTITSTGLFAISILSVIFAPSSWYVPLVGSLLSAILQGVGQFGYLYNKASEQLASFHLFLDHISRSLFAYQMGIDSHNPDQVKRAIDQMLTASELLKK